VRDEAFKKKSSLKLYEIMEARKTIVFVSHSLNKVKNICNRSICLDKRQIVYEGESSEAVEFYWERFSR